MFPFRILNSIRALALVCFSLGFLATPLRGAGDDTYRFTQGMGEERVLNLEAMPGGARWTWALSSKWDTALLGLRLHAIEGAKSDTWVEFTSGSHRLRQHIEADVQGLRWLNITGLRAHLAEGRTVEIIGHGVQVEPGSATLRTFANRPNAKARILILATHPDDAEIAAFGLYAGSDATIVTLTCGNAGDANYKEHFSDVAEQYRFKGLLRAMDSITVPWLGGIPPERCFNLGYFDARLQEMHDRPKEVLAEVYGPNCDISIYRKANLGNLLAKGPRTNSWPHLVEDLAEIFRKVRPTLIVMPHPFLDTHRDHGFTAVAAMEALERWKQPVTLFLYTNHAGKDLYP
ncbi:MAG: PIG-L family deacetylase, partial [Holophaga sp.]|nr:PIG-L family deacetylase [Holophaga sp.]